MPQNNPNPQHVARIRQGVSVWNEWRENREKEYPSPYSTCNLGGANLCELDLRNANFASGTLSGAFFHGADLRGAVFRGSSIIGCDFSHADLRGADLSTTSMEKVNFSWARVDDADFSGARAYQTVFARLDLSSARGLAEVQHVGPSTIGLDTLVLSQGKIPEPFLQGCGLPDEIIVFANSLVRRPIEFSSCFISYSHKDEDFAQKLYADLQSRGVRVWLATHDLPMGARIRDGLEEAIHVHDRLLLILSSDSVASSWVEKEVETAFERESTERRVVLFPIRIDASIMTCEKAWVAAVRRIHNIGDFTNWRSPDDYNKEFARLLRALDVNPDQ